MKMKIHPDCTKAGREFGKTYAWHMDTTKSTKPSQTQFQKSWRAALPLLPQVWCDLPRHDMPKKSCAAWKKSTLFLIKGQVCQGSCYFGRLWHRNFPAVLGCQWPHRVIQSQSNDYNAYDGWSGILKVQNKYAVYFNQLVQLPPNQHRTSWYQQRPLSNSNVKHMIPPYRSFREVPLRV